MPKTSEMHPSNYVQKEDVGKGLLVTIKGLVLRNVALEEDAPDKKWCLLFHEIDKPFILNVTNIGLCEEVLASDDTDQWIGKRIVLYIDPNVPYGGKKVGGIRVRAPKPNAVLPPPVAPPPPVTETELDEPPF